MTEIQKKLFALQDLRYRDFHARLMPTIDKELIIGVRTPALRKLASEIAGSHDADNFLITLPHKYYEENNLHAFIIERTKDFDELISLLDIFLPYIDNWATCDMLSPKVFSKNREKLLPCILCWLHTPHLYTVRFGIVSLMKHFLTDAFSPDYLSFCANVPTDEYYLSMAVAWFFATALTKQWDVALPYITECRLDTVTHNRTIQKATESFCIDPAKKELLGKYRIKVS